ncbi:MAG: FkbM family methyltransferase [Sphingomonadales bacterium]|nr:FkbM family methyltransferase [Sphingomonadales bacterium]
MQLSYAQRLEDYHLDLVFADVHAGFYIDVGGGHPIADNVSYWFYLKGWRGLVVEPQAKLANLYAHIRPRDITACTLVGSREGEVEFHVVDRLHGFSTTVESNAKAAEGMGAGYATERLPMRRLQSLTAQHGITRVDFLKIDVEGAEADVLVGADWTTCRPRVVVLEAVAPGTMAEAWRDWEPFLLSQGYSFAFFDDLNRFYVASECAELAARFLSKPAPWDCVQHLWDFGRAPERPDHPDHVLAQALVRGLLASLPSLDARQLTRLLDAGGVSPAELPQLLVGSAEYPGPEPASQKDIVRLMQSDLVRAALGRIASAYDGGHLME